MGTNENRPIPLRQSGYQVGDGQDADSRKHTRDELVAAFTPESRPHNQPEISDAARCVTG